LPMEYNIFYIYLLRWWMQRFLPKRL